MTSNLDRDQWSYKIVKNGNMDFFSFGCIYTKIRQTNVVFFVLLLLRNTYTHWFLVHIYIYIQTGLAEKAWSSIFTNSKTDKYDIRFEKKQRACLKVLLKLLVIYFLPHQLLLSVFKEKTESCILVVIFLCNVLDTFNPMFHLWKRQFFHNWNIGLKWIEAL